MKPTSSSSAAAIIYYRLLGQLHHWVIDAHGAKDTIESLKAHLEKWIPGAEFVEGRIEKMNMVNRDTANYHERLRWADCLARDATRIETSDGHHISYYDDAWFAHPQTEAPRRIVPGVSVTGNECIKGEDGKPKAFNSAIEAYQACLQAVGYFDQVAEIERRQREVIECSAAL